MELKEWNQNEIDYVVGELEKCNQINNFIISGSYSDEEQKVKFLQDNQGRIKECILKLKIMEFEP